MNNFNELTEQELLSIDGGEDLSHDLGQLLGKWFKQGQTPCNGRLVVAGKTVVCIGS